jgi:hypothetical protein
MNSQLPPHLQAMIDRHEQNNNNGFQPNFQPNPANPLTSMPLPSKMGRSRQDGFVKRTSKKIGDVLLGMFIIMALFLGIWVLLIAQDVISKRM